MAVPPTRCLFSYRPPARATSCGSVRSYACVGFCVAFPQQPPFSHRKTRLCVLLLGELWPFLQVAARPRTKPQSDASRSAALCFFLGKPFCWCDALKSRNHARTHSLQPHTSRTVTVKDRSANGTSGSDGRAGRIMRSNRRS